MAAYTELLARLLPTRSVDPAGRVLAACLQAEGNALDTAAVWAGALLAEDDPRTSWYLLPAWERVLGTGHATDIAARHAYLAAKLNETGGQSRAYFIALAQSMGISITIDEFFPVTVLMDVMSPMLAYEWRFVWRVNLPVAAQVRTATVLSPVMEALAAWGYQDFETMLREDAPAHTLVLFAYQ